MTFFEPSVTLTKTTHIDAPDEYHIEASTVCDKSNYRVLGYQTPSQLNAAGMLEAWLLIEQDPNITETTQPVTLQHSLTVSNLPFEEGTIEVIVATAMQTSAKKGKKEVQTASAGEDDRPVIG
ncbi:MAG: hypothetical protein AAF705_20515 [Bacteroidota bacterium]